MLIENDIEAIFLDTNVFESARFEYTDNNLERLLNLCKEFNITVYIDYIVENEILHRIDENIKNTIEGLKREKLIYLSKICPIEIDSKKIFQQLSDKLKKEFDDLKKNQLKLIKTNVDTFEIASMYFDNKMPFGNGKKKHEFPDAIIGLNIRNFIKSENIELLTITNDNGLINFFNENSLPVVNIVTHAIDLINQQYLTDTYFKTIKNNLVNKIKDTIEHEVEFNIYSYDYQDTVYAEEYEIIDVCVEDIYLLDRDKDEKTFTISCPFKIIINLTTDFYPDYEMGVFDKEDHNWYCFNSKKTTHSIIKNIELNFEISEIENNGKDAYIHVLHNEIDIEFDLYDSSTIIHEDFVESDNREYIYK